MQSSPNLALACIAVGGSVEWRSTALELDNDTESPAATTDTIIVTLIKPASPPLPLEALVTAALSNLLQL